MESHSCVSGISCIRSNICHLEPAAFRVHQQPGKVLIWFLSSVPTTMFNILYLPKECWVKFLPLPVMVIFLKPKPVHISNELSHTGKYISKSTKLTAYYYTIEKRAVFECDGCKFRNLPMCIMTKDMSYLGVKLCYILVTCFLLEVNRGSGADLNRKLILNFRLAPFTHPRVWRIRETSSHPPSDLLHCHLPPVSFFLPESPWWPHAFPHAAPVIVSRVSSACCFQYLLDVLRWGFHSHIVIAFLSSPRLL